MRNVKLLVDPHPSARTPLGTPAAGGMALAAAGIAMAGLAVARGGPIGVIGAVAGSGIAYRGLTGHSMLRRFIEPSRLSGPFPAVPDAAPIRAPADGVIRRTITIARTADVVEALVRDPAAVAAILDTSGTAPRANAARSTEDTLRWRLALPLGQSVEVPLEAGAPGSASVAWRIADGPAAGGTLRLSWRERSGMGETEVEAALALEGDGGPMGLGPVRTLARVALGGILRRVTSLAETGTIATTAGQSSGRADSDRDDRDNGREPGATATEAPRRNAAAAAAGLGATTPAGTTTDEEVRA
jgi:uncharacterized membrane protein